MHKIQVAIVGMGYWGPKIAKVLHLDPNYELVAVSDLNPAMAQEQLSKIGIFDVPTVSNYENLVNFSPNLVVVAVPPQIHIVVSSFFLSRKINVFVEKPVGLSQIERKSLVTLAEMNSVNLFVDHTYLFSPEFNAVRDVVRSGEIGPINFYTSSRVNLGLLQESTNVVEDLMIHDLAILDVLKGESPIRVNCVGNRVKPSRQIGTAFANLVYSDGFVANLSVSWHSPVKIRQINIVGESGAITWNDTSGSDKVKIYSSRIIDNLTPEDFRISYHLGDGRIPRIAGAEPLSKEFQEIFLYLAGKSKPSLEIVNGEQHILRTGKTLEAITKSLELNEPVDVK
jgi:predicted dehydrogenase